MEFLKDENGNSTNFVDSGWLKAEVATYPALYGCQVTKNGWYHVNEKDVRCHYKNCSIQICLDCGKIGGGIGPVGCPCDNTPGWRSEYFEGTGRPRVPALTRGRHGGKVARSIVRHKLAE